MSNPSLRKAQTACSALSDGRDFRDGQLESEIFRAKFRTTVGTVPSFFSWKPETVLFLSLLRKKRMVSEKRADVGIGPYGVRRRLLRSAFAGGKSSTSAVSFFLSKR